MTDRIQRGDTARIESKANKYDGHTGTVYQVYEDHAKLKLDNTDGVVVNVAWDNLTAAGG